MRKIVLAAVMAAGFVSVPALAEPTAGATPEPTPTETPAPQPTETPKPN